MEAAAALGGGEEVSLHDLRLLVGTEVEVDTDSGPLTGTLLSCTSRSAWIVGDDVDHVVELPRVQAIRRR